MALEDITLCMSNSCTGFRGMLNIEENFKLADSIDIRGLELIPFKHTDEYNIFSLSENWGVEIKGVHFPLYWYTKSLDQTLKSEKDFKERIYQLVFYKVTGKGNLDCSASRIAELIGDAYLLFHPDTFNQIPEDEKEILLQRSSFYQREIFFENERSKKIYWKELNEGSDTHNPYLIKENLPVLNEKYNVNANLMFDPRHFQIAQEEGLIKKISLYDAWNELKPEGLHFSFYNPEKGVGHNLPTHKSWEEISAGIKENPPRYIVIEMASPDDAAKAREIIGKEFGI